MQWRCESKDDVPGGEFNDDSYSPSRKALDGRNGQVLWSYDKSNHEVFALNCQRDIDGDGVLDCITGGRGGVSDIRVLSLIEMAAVCARLWKRSADDPVD